MLALRIIESMNFSITTTVMRIEYTKKNLPESELDRVEPRPVCRKKVWMHNVSLRSCPYCLGARLTFSQRSHDPKKGVETRRLFYFLFPRGLRHS